MNNCILMAKVVRNPELRYTQDTQTPVSQMLVQFEGGRPDDPPSTLKVIGWGNLATQIQEQYSEGDQLILEGRLAMNTIDRPEGFREKRAELVASRIYLLGSKEGSPKVTPTPSKKVVSMESYQSPQPMPGPAETSSDVPTPSPSPTPTPQSSEPEERNLDDIPF